MIALNSDAHAAMIDWDMLIVLDRIGHPTTHLCNT